MVALHAIVDSFIAPEPGTAWNDHLLRGGATLALLVGAWTLYPRLRAGARVAVAGTMGVLPSTVPRWPFSTHAPPAHAGRTARLGRDSCGFRRRLAPF